MRDWQRECINFNPKHRDAPSSAELVLVILITVTPQAKVAEMVPCRNASHPGIATVASAFESPERPGTAVSIVSETCTQPAGGTCPGGNGEQCAQGCGTIGIVANTFGIQERANVCAMEELPGMDACISTMVSRWQQSFTRSGMLECGAAHERAPERYEDVPSGVRVRGLGCSRRRSRCRSGIGLT